MNDPLWSVYAFMQYAMLNRPEKVEMSNDLVSQFTHFGMKYDGNLENPVFSIENPHEGYNLHVSKFRATTRIQFCSWRAPKKYLIEYI